MSYNAHRTGGLPAVPRRPADRRRGRWPGRGERSSAATDIVADPALLDLYPGAHLLLRDQSWAMRFDTLTVALDLLAPRGWQAVGITFIQNSGELCALLRRVSETPPEGEPWPYEQ